MRKVDVAVRYQWARVYPGHGKTHKFRDYQRIPGQLSATRRQRRILLYPKFANNFARWTFSVP